MMIRTCRPLTEDQVIQTGLEIGPQWIELAESLKFLEENRSKLSHLKSQIDLIISENTHDSTYLAARINDYKVALQV